MLRLTKRSEYGLMALAHLARAGEQFSSARSMVRELGVPKRLLAEVLKELARSGFLTTARGPGGGYRLDVDPKDVPLSSVVEALEGPLRVADCYQNGECVMSENCTIQDGIREVASRIHGVLENFTLADLCTPEPQNWRPVTV